MKIILDSMTAIDLVFLMLAGGVTFTLFGIVFITVLLAVRRG